MKKHFSDFDYSSDEYYLSIKDKLRNLLISFPKDRKRNFLLDGYYFEKGVADDFGIYDVRHASYEIEKGGFGFFEKNSTQIVEKIKEILDELKLEYNLENYSKIILYMLYYIYKFREKGLEYDEIFDFHKEPAILLGHNFQYIPLDFSKPPKNVIQTFEQIQKLYDLCLKEFEDSVAMLLNIKLYFDPSPYERFYRRSVDTFLALLMSMWLILKDPVQTETIVSQLKSFMKDYLKPIEFKDVIYKTDSFNSYLRTKFRIIMIDEGFLQMK